MPVNSSTKPVLRRLQLRYLVLDVAHALVKRHPHLYAVESAVEVNIKAVARGFAKDVSPTDDTGVEIEAAGASIKPRKDVPNANSVVLASVTVGEEVDLLAARDVDCARRGLGSASMVYRERRPKVGGRGVQLGLVAGLQSAMLDLAKFCVRGRLLLLKRLRQRCRRARGSTPSLNTEWAL